MLLRVEPPLRGGGAVEGRVPPLSEERLMIKKDRPEEEGALNIYGGGSKKRKWKAELKS